MTNLKHVLSVVLAAATLLAVLLFFVRGALLLLPGSTPDSAGRDCAGDWTGVVRTGGSYKRNRVGNGGVRCIKEAEIISCGGLLAVSSVLLIIPALIATEYLAVIVVPGPILGVISGLGILGLGIAKSIRSARTAVVMVK